MHCNHIEKTTNNDVNSLYCLLYIKIEIVNDPGVAVT